MATIHEFTDYLEVSSDNVKIFKSKKHYTGIILNDKQFTVILDDETVDNLYDVLSEFIKKKEELDI